jgi:hypothetical protein
VSRRRAEEKEEKAANLSNSITQQQSKGTSDTQARKAKRECGDQNFSVVVVVGVYIEGTKRYGSAWWVPRGRRPV